MHIKVSLGRRDQQGERCLKWVKEAQREKKERGRIPRGYPALGFAQNWPGECLCDKGRKSWARAILLHAGQASAHAASLRGVTTLPEWKPRSKEQHLQ